MARCGDSHSSGRCPAGFGAGRTAAFASDCAPHWCPPGFLAWPGYNPSWANLIGWLGGQ